MSVKPLYYVICYNHDVMVIFKEGGGGGGCNPKKLNATANFKFGTGFFRFFFSVFFLVFFGFFRFFFGFSIFAWFNGFLLSGSRWL